MAKSTPAAATRCAAGRPLPPQRAAERHRSEERRDEHCKPAPARPFGQRHLRGDIGIASTAIQDTPAITHADKAVAASRAMASKPNVIAVPHVPAATDPIGPSLAFNQGNANAPATAPAPMTPRREP